MIEYIPLLFCHAASIELDTYYFPFQVSPNHPYRKFTELIHACIVGFLCFLVLCISFLVHPGLELPWDETLVITLFFVSAILALGFSWTFHTVYCHSEHVGRFFGK